MKELNCKLFGHSLVKTNLPFAKIKEYKCTCCKKQFTKDGYGEIVVLDSYWRQNNENLRASLSFK